jgi:hypothetical protein
VTVLSVILHCALARGNPFARRCIMADKKTAPAGAVFSLHQPKKSRLPLICLFL